jgi:hypothetical protein
VNLINATLPIAKQECRSDKKKKRSIVKEGAALIEEDLEDDLPIPNNTAIDEVQVSSDYNWQCQI